MEPVAEATPASQAARGLYTRERTKGHLMGAI